MSQYKRIAAMLFTDKQETGSHGNTRWRMTGNRCDVDISGCLQVANGRHFDRWANSATVTISLETIEWEGGNVLESIKRALRFYN